MKRGRGNHLCFSDRDDCHSNMKFWVILYFEQVDKLFEYLVRKNSYTILNPYLELITSVLKCWNMRLELLRLQMLYFSALQIYLKG